MEKFFRAGERYSPTLNFDPDKNLLEFIGQSYPEHAEDIYNPAFEWIGEFLKTEGRNITVNIKLTYFNTASSRRLQDLMEILEAYEKSGRGSVLVNWYYKSEDYDMMECGEDYIEAFDLNIRLIELDS
jgi:hypothetical protein